MTLKRNGVDMAAHVPSMSLVEACLDTPQLTRRHIETAWNSKVVGSTIMESPKVQKSCIEITVSH